MLHILQFYPFLRSTIGKLITVLLVVVATLILPAAPVQAVLPNPRLLKDINPGAIGSLIDLNPIVINEILYFTVDDGTHGSELWRSDGTRKGTFLVKDIYAGGDSARPWFFINVNGMLFFAADDGVHGRELWKSDGTEAGTVMVKDINPGLSYTNLFPLADVNGTLFFAADDGMHGYELWKSDGNEAGTVLVKDINPGPGGVGIGHVTNVHNMLFFPADDGSHGQELWRSDGTEVGTVLVKDINPGPSDADPFDLTNINGTVLFFAGDGSHGNELWRSDGTATGTFLVKDINLGPDDSHLDYYQFGLTNINGKVFFDANDGTHGWELWRSDGTASGTILLKDIYPGPFPSSPTIEATINGVIFFMADDGTHGYELWRSDGTKAGTVMLKDINPGAGGFISDVVTSVNDMLYFSFSGYDGRHDVIALWKSDGTKAGTKLVKDIHAAPDAEMEFMFNANGTLFFSALNRLWKSDGTKARTVPVGNIDPLITYPEDGMLVLMNNLFLLVAENRNHGAEWWVVDLTKPTTTQETLLDAAADAEVLEENSSDVEAVYQVELADQEAELAYTDENAMPEKLFLPLITMTNSITAIADENLLNAATEEEIPEESISDAEAEAVYQAELAAHEAKLTQINEGIADAEVLPQKVFLPLIAR